MSKKTKWVDGKNLDSNIWGGKSLFFEVVESKDDTPYVNTINDIRIDVTGDGALSLFESGGEGSIYFYPEQLTHLRKALAMAMKQKREADANRRKPASAETAPVGAEYFQRGEEIP